MNSSHYLVLFLLVVIATFLGWLIANEENIHSKDKALVNMIRYVVYDGHEYVVIQDYHNSGITHSPKCKCNE